MYTNIFYYFLLTFKLFFSAFTITNAIAGSIFYAYASFGQCAGILAVIGFAFYAFNLLELNRNLCSYVIKDVKFYFAYMFFMIYVHQ